MPDIDYHEEYDGSFVTQTADGFVIEISAPSDKRRRTVSVFPHGHPRAALCNSRCASLSASKTNAEALLAGYRAVYAVWGKQVMQRVLTAIGGGSP